MSATSLSRRGFLAALTLSAAAPALDRRPYGGILRLSLPLSLDELDPHAPDHAASALFSTAVADPLYSWDGRGQPYPALAASLPARTGTATLRVELRPGLVTARGRTLGAEDVVASLERARRGAAGPLLAPFGRPRPVPGGPLLVAFDGEDPAALAQALASPTTAIVPRRFNPGEPDGTGAFRAMRTASGFLLERNENAARGPAFLDRIELVRTGSLAEALRAFEAGGADVGFLGAGLHRKRQDSEPLSAPPAGFVVLRTGTSAKEWGAPGVASRLVEGIPRDRFAHLGLSLPGGGAAGVASAGWGGPATDLIVDQASAYLVEIARATVTELSRPGHQLAVLPVARPELRRRIAAGTFGLALDVVRTAGPTPRHALLALLRAGSPRLADRPPAVTPEPHVLSRTLPLAVLGDLAVRGAASTAFRGLSEWDLGGVWKAS